MSFVLQWNDLESLQMAMTLALRKAACRSFALQALNWLIRSVSQPACLHDLLWCFVSALGTNSQGTEAVSSTAATNVNNINDEKKEAPSSVAVAGSAAASNGATAAVAAASNPSAAVAQVSSKKGSKKVEGLFDHPTEDISIAGEAIQPLPTIFHGLLQTVSDLMLLLPVGSSLQQIAITCWCIKFRPQDHNFLHQSHVFSTISKILSR